MTYLEKVLKLRDLLLSSNFCVVLTGAGVSVPSGIPDFRSTSGVYAKYGQEIFDINVFKGNPEKFYEFAKQELFKMLDTQPNEVHNLIAILEQKGIVKGLITQNIDDLHKRAGNKQIAQIHGNVRVWN
ncbi:MAG: Sir2 family NAD-dependent protein deacetylase, partial [Fervidobacterium sp.]